MVWLSCLRRIQTSSTDWTGTLRAHLPAWRQINAGTFALSVIENGYIPNLGPMPTFYAEANNKSYRENADFANEAVMKPAQVWGG